MRKRWPHLYLMMYNKAVKARCHEYMATTIVPTLKTGTKRGTKAQVHSTPTFRPTASRGRKNSPGVRVQAPDIAVERWDSPAKGRPAAPARKKSNYIRKYFPLHGMLQYFSLLQWAQSGL